MAHSKDFKDFSAADLINEPYFQDWILFPTEEKNSFWQNFIKTYPEKEAIIAQARGLLKSIAFKENWPSEENVDRSLNDALNTINAGNGKALLHKMNKHTRSMHSTWWAAAAVLVLAAGAWWFMNRDETKKSSQAVAAHPHDIAPGGDKALLTLADGTRVILDTTNNGAISRQGNVTVIKLNGQLAYNKEGAASKEVLFNTITTPRGGQYQLILADGTKVWLNAASSLRYPTTFAGNERSVELTGEGYFEVVHDAKKPFHVKFYTASGDAGDVQVLGTHFNINSYDDEPNIKTTLLEGRVMVTRQDKQAYLSPGQQAIVRRGEETIRVDNDVNTEEAIAWKNGLFIFNNTPLDAIMRQIGRWYNVDVVYQDKIPQETFNGAITRNTNLSEVLKVLEYTNIRFTVDGNTITVLSQ